MISAPEHERPTTSAIVPVDAPAERRAFESWWRAWCPDRPVPSAASHVFDAWLARARLQAPRSAQHPPLPDHLRLDADPKVHHLGAALQSMAAQHADVLTPRQQRALCAAAHLLWDYPNATPRSDQ